MKNKILRYFYNLCMQSKQIILDCPSWQTFFLEIAKWEDCCKNCRGRKNHACQYCKLGVKEIFTFTKKDVFISKWFVGQKWNLGLMSIYVVESNDFWIWSNHDYCVISWLFCCALKVALGVEWVLLREKMRLDADKRFALNP